MSGPIRVRILLRAEREIANQAAYYREKASRELEQRWRLAVNDTIRSLHQFPERAATLFGSGEDREVSRYLHVIGFPNHLIFYRWHKQTQTVLVTNVLHGARDLARLLGRS